MCFPFRVFSYVIRVFIFCSWRPKEEYGWVAPVVNSHNYNVRFQSSIDWTSLDIRYGDSLYLNATGPEWTSLTFPFIDPRYRNEVKYFMTGIERPPVPYGVELSPTMDFVTGTLPASIARNWTVMLAMPNTSYTWYRPYQHRIRVQSFQCPPDGCPLPPAPQIGAAGLWSSPSTWPNGTLPRAGDDVLINATMNVVLDISPPPLGRLTIQGRLSFLDLGAGSAPIVLSVGQIVVWGQFAIGNSTLPYQGNAHIVLNGDRTSGGAVIVDDSLPPQGNKNIVVLGSFSAVGVSVNATWVRLAQTAVAGSSQITLAKPAFWTPGQLVALTPTNYNMSQLEELVIAAVRVLSA